MFEISDRKHLCCKMNNIYIIWLLVVIIIYYLINCLILDIESDDLIPPGNDEIKDNQWLGVTVRSQGIGGKVMVWILSHFIYWYY